MSVEWSNKSVPWITKDGSLDAAKFPIEGILRQAMASETRLFESGLGMLRMMYSGGREEAGVFLMGLLVATEDNWDRRLAIVKALREVQTDACARLLFAEIRQTKSSNTTRRYLNAVIEALAAMPAALVQEDFEALAHDPSFSYKLRNKFKAVAACEPDFPGDWR